MVEVKIEVKIIQKRGKINKIRKEVQVRPLLHLLHNKDLYLLHHHHFLVQVQFLKKSNKTQRNKFRKILKNQKKIN